MKSTLLVALIGLFFSTVSVGQDIKIQADESTGNFSTGRQNAIVVTVFEADMKEVEKAWKKEMKGMKAKVTAKKEVFADDATMKDMGENSFDVYAVFEEIDNVGIKVYAAFDLGGAYLSSREHPDRFKAAKKFMYNFGVDQTKAKIAGDVRDAEKMLDKREKEYKDLQKQKDDLEKLIDDCEKKISQAKKDIQTNLSNQDTKQKEISSQDAVVKTLEAKLKAVN